MKVEIEGVNYNVEFDKSFTNSIIIVFIHGFTGSTKDWQFLTKNLDKKFNPIFIDLIGHGLSDSPENENLYSEVFIINSLKKIFKKLKLANFILAGYSMGGRVALTYTLENPDQVKAVILEGTNPGIKEKSERNRKEKSDHQLSVRLENEELESFLNYWYRQEIFNSLNDIEIESLIQSKRLNNRFGLAKVLRNFSTGKMKNKWNELNEINCPTLLISGEFDKKYCEINKLMSGKINLCQQKIIKNAGHNTHFENQFEYISVVNNFLTSYF